MARRASQERGRACTCGPRQRGSWTVCRATAGFSSRRSLVVTKTAVAPRKPSWTRWVWTEQDEDPGVCFFTEVCCQGSRAELGAGGEERLF